MFARCSQDTIYVGFHTAWPSVPEWAIEIELLVVAGDVHRDGQAIAALEGEKIVGHAMHVKDQSNVREAEVAVIVEDGRRSSGVGRTLLSRISEEVRRAGIEAFTCTTLGTTTVSSPLCAAPSRAAARRTRAVRARSACR